MPNLMVCRVYAIRHTPTGKYMPQSKSRRGYTAIAVDKFHSSEPRLFWTMHGAGRALKCWLMGAWDKEAVYQDSYTGEWDVDGGTPPDNPDPTRRLEDMEIVSFELQEMNVPTILPAWVVKHG